MRTFLQARGFDVWQALVNGYKTLASTPTNAIRKRLYENNLKAMNVILSGLVDSIYVKVMHCDSVKKIWDKLQNVYEGDAKVNGGKLKTYRGQFEHIKMNEYEDIATYFLQVDEIVNTIRGLGEEIKGLVIVQNILRSLRMRFDPNFLSLEEREDLATLSMDEMDGIIIAYEMRTEQDNPSKREVAFKASKRTRKRKKKSNSSSICNDDSDEDEK
jgi:hypothetical protein